MTEFAPRIVVDPAVRFGRPVIRGTRVPVATIVAKLAGGLGAEEIMTEYEVTRDDVQAALRYAAQFAAQVYTQDFVYNLPGSGQEIIG